MVTILPIASGKGGVGKTVLSANLGVALAKAGKTVVLMDLDLGGSNLHTVLGVRNRHAGVGNLIFRQEEELESLLVPTSQDRLFLIPGDALLPGTANLPYFRKQKIIKETAALVADFVILDLGSGTTYNTVDFFLAGSDGVIVCTPETTSILNAYSFIKTSVYRILYRSFPSKSPERGTVQSFIEERIEGSDDSFDTLRTRLGEISDNAAEVCRKCLKDFRPRVVLNMGRSPEDLEIGRRLRTISRRNLGIEVNFIGYLPREELMTESIIQRKPVIDLNPTGAFARSLAMISQRIINAPRGTEHKLYEDDADIRELTRAAQTI